MEPTVSILVRLQTTEFTDAEAIVVECPMCFAIVMESKLDAHKVTSHA
jgi:hypothetical protein